MTHPTFIDWDNISCCSSTRFVTTLNIQIAISTTQVVGYLMCATIPSLYGTWNWTQGFMEARQPLSQLSYSSSCPDLLLCFGGSQRIKKSTSYNRIFKLSISGDCFGFHTIETNRQLSAFYCHVTSLGNNVRHCFVSSAPLPLSDTHKALDDS